MPITKAQAALLRNHIRKLVDAERDEVMRGAQPPEDWPEIDERLRRARYWIKTFIKNIQLDDEGKKPT